MKIFLDPGHGGVDPGAVGKKSKEKDNVLKVALKLESYLKKQGHQVRLSRRTDVFVTLAGRAQDANKWGADIFISLHNNAAVRKEATGFETFIYNKTTNAKTKELQNKLHPELAKHIGIVDRGKKAANFAVLRETSMPAVLIEYAFISNVDDEKILMNEVNRLAEFTADGINAFAGKEVSKPTPKPSKPKEEKPKQEAVKPKPTPKPKPKKPKITKLTVDNTMGQATVYGLQQYYDMPVKDKKISHQWKSKATAGIVSNAIQYDKTQKGSPLIRKIQADLGVTQDGLLGYKTIKAWQKRYGLIADGEIWTVSALVGEIQRRLNNNKLF